MQANTYYCEGNVEESHPSHERATSHWAVEVAPGIDPDKLAAAHGFVNLGPVGTLTDIYLFHKNTNTRGEPSVDHEPLHKSPHVKWTENQVSKKRFRRSTNLPNDPLFGNQWHLKNSFGVDINVVDAWNNGYSGEGVTVAMVDDGLQRTHPDISPNYFADGSYDFNEYDPYPDPHAGDDHGTSAGGVAAAKNNNGVCGTGAAPNAKLSGTRIQLSLTTTLIHIRYILVMHPCTLVPTGIHIHSTHTKSNHFILHFLQYPPNPQTLIHVYLGIRLIADYTTDAQEAAGLTFHTDVNHIYSNSWGPNDDGRRLEKPGRLTVRAMEDAVTNGRGGKGSIYVWAGGNGRSSGDNCNYDGYANSRFTIAIGAVDYMVLLLILSS